MIRYTLYQKNPASHYIYIDLTVDQVSSDTLRFQLPAWRPGRYELGNFARNIKRVDFFDQDNKPLRFQKKTKDLWQVESKDCTSVKATYSYYAAEMNAGACYADSAQVYVNPVHCCMWVEGRQEEEHVVTANVPESYRLVSSMRTEGYVMHASGYEELVDSPFIASAFIKTEQYEVDGISFYLHFNGECKPDFKKIKTDFTAFTKRMISFWGDFPHREYHFLFQVTPFKFYHGVEHHKNTVIAIGPGYALNTGGTYEDLLGVSCHELFHTWNVKSIRPVEMLPYDFSRENYAQTGYVYEGFTTYYGDKLLLCSGVFTTEQYFATLQERLVKHFHNFGRYNLSVAASSFETWLDGYVPGAPYRKTNIYDEGNLVAFMLDVLILKTSSHKKSLRDVCVLLYERFGKKAKGYSEKDIIGLVGEVCGGDQTRFFEKTVYDAADYEPFLREAFDYLGIGFNQAPSPLAQENLFGFKTTDIGSVCRVSLVAPYSPAWKAGLFAGDEIIAVNRMIVHNNVQQWLHYFAADEEIVLTLNSAEQLKQVVLKKDHKGNTYFHNPVLIKTEGSKEQQKAFDAWLKL
jgi:predicted metalloprotease with PDZ domain